MTVIPNNPKIYHITHLRNLADIIRAGVLWSDAKRIELGLDCEIVGMSDIKRRRLEELSVDCHPGTKVGQYVPFYFCPRSIMLYILHMGNHPDLNYREGQRPVIHLQADLAKAVRWAANNGVRWAFSDRNAGTFMQTFIGGLRTWTRLTGLPCNHQISGTWLSKKENRQSFSYMNHSPGIWWSTSVLKTNK